MLTTAAQGGATVAELMSRLGHTSPQDGNALPARQRRARQSHRRKSQRPRRRAPRFSRLTVNVEARRRRHEHERIDPPPPVRLTDSDTPG